MVKMSESSCLAQSEADHITHTETMGRDYVTEGYTSEDAK